MDPAPSPVIHDVLPSDILAVVFEEHATLDWKAPIVDELVCHLWRQIVRNTPRAWAYLEICHYYTLASEPLRSWLHLSGTAPLHIRVDENFTLDNYDSKLKLFDLLGDHHTRMASLRMGFGDYTFFIGREFPRLRHLDIEAWYPTPPSSTMLWGPMPQLLSLHSGPIDFSVVPWNELASLKMLTLWNTGYTVLQQHSKSLTTLMLEDVILTDIISGPVDFLSLTYLSLWDVTGLKPHVNSPCLITYHEGGETQNESFSAPVHSLAEYGVYGLEFSSTEWNHYFPNLARLSVRADAPVLISIFDSLSNPSHSIPSLEIINAGLINSWDFTDGDLEIMDSKVPLLGVAVIFETAEPFHIPIFFGEVYIYPPHDL
jgi:hypothetical protein